MANDLSAVTPQSLAAPLRPLAAGPYTPRLVASGRVAAPLPRRGNASPPPRRRHPMSR